MVFQMASLHFPGRPFRQFLDDMNRLGDFEIRQFALTVALQISCGNVTVGHHRRMHLFAIFVMRRTEASRLGHRGVCQQSGIHFQRRDFFAAAVDKFLDSADERWGGLGPAMPLVLEGQARLSAWSMAAYLKGEAGA